MVNQANRADLQTLVVRRIDPKSLAKMSAAVSAVLGVPYGLWAAAMVLYLGEIATKELNLPKNAVLAVSMAAGVGLPLFMILGGVIYGLLGAVFYNWLASWLGGIRLDVALPSGPRSQLPREELARTCVADDSGNGSPTIS
jgi:hypothetical protein